MVGSLVALEQRVGRSSEAHWAGKKWVEGILLKGQGICLLSCKYWEPLKSSEEDSGKTRAGLWGQDLVPV